MANYTKSFNFRNGVQVDDNNFIINPSGLVGIGTTKPEKLLDVYGNARISGISSLSSVNISGVATVGSGINIDAASGIITAIKFVGDGSGLTNTVAITTDGFIAQAGSIGTTAKVGVGTESPRSQFDVVGNVRVEGISTFTGNGNYSAGLAIDVVGHTELDNLNVSGLSTFGGNVDINADIDVDGHTELDDLSVSGVSTFSDDVDFIGDPVGTALTSIQFHKGDGTNSDLDTLRFYDSSSITLGVGNTGGLSLRGNWGQGSYILASGDNFFLDGGASTAIKIRTQFARNAIVANSGNGGSGTVELYHSAGGTATKKLETSGLGVTVYGTVDSTQLNVTGIATIGVASITTLNPVKALVATGIATFKDDVQFHGFAGVTSAFWDKDNNRLELKDNVKLTFGETRDLQISHNGTDSIIKDAGVGRLKILGGFQVKNVGDTQTLITANTSGANATNVELYHANTLKFETVSVGASTYGQLKVARLNGGTSDLSQSYGALRYGNENAAFDYSTRKSLDLLNYDTGNINFNLDASNDNVDVGNFYWSKYNNPIMTLTNGGNLGIGITEPEYKLHVSGISTFTGDVTAGNNLLVGNDLTINNNLTVSNINADLTGNVTGNLTGNFYTTSGISTAYNFKAGTIGIGTTGSTDYPLKVNNGLTSNMVSVDALGKLKVENNLLVEGSSTFNNVSLTTNAELNVGSVSSSGAVDFKDAGAITKRFMVPPKVSTTERGNLTGLVAGAMIYNTSDDKIQVYNGTSWETITSS